MKKYNYTKLPNTVLKYSNKFINNGLISFMLIYIMSYSMHTKISHTTVQLSVLKVSNQELLFTLVSNRVVPIYMAVWTGLLGWLNFVFFSSHISTGLVW